MKTVITMATAFALLLSLTACSDNPCNKYSNSHQKDYCNNKQASKEVISYLDHGATPAPRNEWITLENATKAFKKAMEIKGAIL